MHLQTGIFSAAAHRHAQGFAQEGALHLLPLDAQRGEGGVAAVALKVRDEVLDDRRRYYVPDVLCILMLHSTREAKDMSGYTFSRTGTVTSLGSCPHSPASMTQAMAVLREAVAPMLAWLQRWRRPAADAADAAVAVEVPRSGGCRAAVAVAGVVDIEESVWAPRYGLKGMIDASVALRLAPLLGARQVIDSEFSVITQIQRQHSEVEQCNMRASVNVRFVHLRMLGFGALKLYCRIHDSMAEPCDLDQLVLVRQSLFSHGERQCLGDRGMLRLRRRCLWWGPWLRWSSKPAKPTSAIVHRCAAGHFLGALSSQAPSPENIVRHGCPCPNE